MEKKTVIPAALAVTAIVDISLKRGFVEAYRTDEIILLKKALWGRPSQRLNQDVERV